jgi:hypothetical protein
MNVEVSSLRMGLSKCRTIAEHVIDLLRGGQECDVVLAMETLVDEARQALTVAEDERILDEVGTVLKDEEDGKSDSTRQECGDLARLDKS